MGLLVILLIGKITDTNVLEEIFKISPLMMFFGFLIFCTGYVVDSIRTIIVLKVLGYKINFFDAFYNNVIGCFFSNITPFAAGGQPFQVYHLSSLGVPSEKGTNFVMSRFLESMVTNLVVSFIFYKPVISVLQGKGVTSKLITVGLVLSVSIAVFFFVLFLNSNIIAKFVNFLEKSKILKKRDLSGKIFKWSEELNGSITFLWKEKIYVMVLDFLLGLATLVIQAGVLFFFIVMLTKVMYTFNTFMNIFGGMTLLNMVVYYIPTPGASGGTELFYHWFVGDIVKDSAMSLQAVFAWRWSTYYLQIFFGMGTIVFYKLLRKRKS